MKRIEAIRTIVEERPDAYIVCNLGFPSRELFHIRDSARNFYMLGSMGMASSIGLGLALAQKKKEIITIDGDGSILMNLGSLATIASHNPKNYMLVIMDNGVYGSTGYQPTPTSHLTRLVEIAEAAGIRPAIEVNTELELRYQLKTTRHGVLVVKVEPENADVPEIPLSPQEIVDRFISAVTQPSG
ncbi:MAG: sulfopyruvate decarboxylase subunit beta [Methanomassiliicoccales archaeon]|nr:sulfopyruvate decarboxylase subunit beta [Methanomassiliicoccales archaeon]